MSPTDYDRLAPISTFPPRRAHGRNRTVFSGLRNRHVTIYASWAHGWLSHKPEQLGRAGGSREGREPSNWSDVLELNQRNAAWKAAALPFGQRRVIERMMGVGPTRSSMARKCRTVWLHPRVEVSVGFGPTVAVLQTASLPLADETQRGEWWSRSTQPKLPSV